MTLQEVMARHPEAEPFRFGSGPEMNADYNAGLLSGRKTGSTVPLASFAATGDPVPVADRLYISLDWDGGPVCAIRTDSVEIRTFAEVDEVQALADGGVDNLEDWRRIHEAFWRRTGCWSLDLELVCERFHVTEVYR